MGRMYAVTFDNISISAAQDLFYVAPDDDKPVCLHGIVLSNVGGTADAGDAQEELLRLGVIRGHTTVGSGGNAFTALPLNPNDTAAGFTSRINDTTIASGGTGVNVLADGWNVRVPYQMFWTPETRPYCTQAAGGRIVVRLLAAPADAVTCAGTLYVEELT